MTWLLPAPRFRADRRPVSARRRRGLRAEVLFEVGGNTVRTSTRLSSH